MKMLHWVHRRFQNSNLEPLKDLSVGIPATTTYRYGSTFLEPPRKDQTKTYTESEARREEERTAIVSELFHGFLTIGTFGLETSVNEPDTPTFATPLETLTEQKSEVSENDLKLISYELERFLEAKTRKDGVCPSSARDSHASTITLGGMQIEDSEDEEYSSTVVCPLQGYLLGSSVELPEMRTEVKKKKASLQELFDRAKVAEYFEKNEEKNPEQKSKSAMRFMKKLMKKLSASPKSSAAYTNGHPTDPVSITNNIGEASDSVSTKKKPHKVLRLFKRRVHPEGPVAAKELMECKKYKGKSNSSNGGCCNWNLMLIGGENKRLHHESKLQEETKYCKKYMDLPRNGSNFRGNEEHWIKTDADYLVLEL